MRTHTARIIRARRRRRIQKRGNASYFLRWIGAFVTTSVILVLIGILAVIGTGVGIYVYYARELPPPARIELVQSESFETTVLYDKTGQNVLYEVIPPTEGDRQKISIHDLPDYFLDATVAIEDSSFYENPGFNVRGIARAMWANLTGGEIQGGSTITQQLVKNVLLTDEDRTELTVDRKIKEIILASEISRLYSKDQILEWYINTNFYGNLAYGVEAASQVYFNKSARTLTLGEAALIAAIPQFPQQNPIDNPDAARVRQELVLRRMVSLGYITQTDMDAALAEEIIIRPFEQRFEIVAPHFSIYARNEAESILNQLGYDGAYLITRGGVRIYTTLDVDLQQELECVSRTHVMRLDGADPNFVHNTNTGEFCDAANYLPPLTDDLLGIDRTVTNAAGVVIRADTGEIVAMMGSVDFWNQGIDGNFNVATAERQPGSTFKPLVYMTAFLTPLDPSTIVTPATMLSDVRLEFNEGGGESYVPTNIDLQYHGPVSVREALANSYNVPVVQVLNWVGLSNVIRTAHRMGINSLNDPLTSYGLSLALGAGEVSLLDITYAYNIFNTLGYAVGTPVHSSEARQGYRQLNPVSVLRIEDANGKVLWEYSDTKGTFDRRLILPPGMAYIMTDILADREARLKEFQRGNPLELSRPAAAKTGTTDDNRDSWTIGYIPEYTVGVWVGNNDNTPMTDITGVSGAAPIWHAVMEYVAARDNLPPDDWQRPSTVVEQTVCLWSGLLPTQNCAQVPGELFYVDPVNGVDYRPKKQDDMWYRLPIDTCNNTRANDTTPPQCVQENIYFDFPPEFDEWAQTNTPELIPPAAEGIIRDEGSQFSPVAIVAPRFPAQVSGQVEVFGNTQVEDLAYYQLGFGNGNEPSSFIQIGTDGDTQEFNHLLGTWDTTGLEDGVYTLRLQIVRENNQIEATSTRVTVDNTPPEIRLTAPQEASTFYADTDIVVTLESEVFDAGIIERVEFYIDQLNVEGEETPETNIKLGESTAFPYNFTWAIEDFGGRTFWAVAYDRAGNRTESNHVLIQLQEQAP